MTLDGGLMSNSSYWYIEGITASAYIAIDIFMPFRVSEGVLKATASV